jgi:porphobilinogen synthase
MSPTRRPRRLRADGVRDLVSETSLSAADLIAPVFVDATTDERVPIPSMPGHSRVPVEGATDRVEEVLATGVEAVILFGIPESKDAEGSRAWAEDGVVQRATRQIVSETDAYVITDVCLCEYTTHGHCGVLEPGAEPATAGGDAASEATGPTSEPADESGSAMTVANDATLDRLQRTAVSHAAAGADMVAPSSMTDGMVGAIRTALDEAGYDAVPIMSYAAKYESAFYGPFRDAADGAPAFGDRRHYQMDPANAREATREVSLDVEEGADVLMVKPALPYLDVVASVREEFDHPVAAYNVSGEYAMLHAAHEKGWLDLDSVAHESLLSIKRAGADLILTYFAEDVARSL